MNDKTGAEVPTFDELMWPVLKALKAMGGSASNEELLAKVIELEHIPEDIASFLHVDHRQTKLGYNLAWAKTYLKSAGALENSTRGVWISAQASPSFCFMPPDRLPARRC